MRKRAHLQIVFLVFSVAFPTVRAQTSDADRQQEIETHLRQAHERLAEKKPEAAIPELKAVVALDPNNVDALGNLGVLLFFRGNYAEAVPNLRAALKLQPSLSKIQALLGMSEERTGEAANARADLESAFSQLQEPKIRIQTGMELINLYSSSGDLDKAASTVSVLRQIDPTNVQVLYTAYRIYSDLSGEAMLSLSLVAPESAQMHQIMAHELARQANSEGAIAQYRKAIQIDPKLAGIHFELAEMLNASDDARLKAGAEQEYRAALNENHADEKTECRLGDISARKGDLKQAYAYYSEAVRLQPSDEEANFDLAKTLIAMDQSSKALPVLEHAVQLDPTDATAHYRLSNLYRQQGRTEDAKHEVEEYKKYKEMKEKLREIYKEMRIQPSANNAEEHDDK
jgi:tetratricopeptide (TPR) repeat protein